MSTAENHNFIPDDLSNYKVVRRGNLVINKMKAWQGSMGIAPCDGIVSPAYYVLELRVENPLFAHSLLRSKPYVDYFARVSDGVRIGQWDLSIPGMKRIPVLLPPPDEQAAIVKFLNHAERRIGSHIQAKKKLIKLLEEQKQVIIHRAVTSGLGSDVPHVSTETPWLETIPQHWEMRRLKTLFREVNERSQAGEETLLSLRMYEGLVPHEEVSAKQIPKSALVGYKKVQPGQLVMNRMRAAIGIFGVPRQAGIVSPDYAIFEPTSDANPHYYLRLFKTAAMCQEFRMVSKGLGTGSSGFMRLYTDEFGVLWVPKPPLDEQREIIAGIDAATASVEQGIRIARREVELLQEYQARLISDVVTGKLDVRQAAESLPELQADKLEQWNSAEDDSEALGDELADEVAA